MDNLTEQELANLSEEERAAVQDTVEGELTDTGNETGGDAETVVASTDGESGDEEAEAEAEAEETSATDEEADTAPAVISDVAAVSTDDAAKTDAVVDDSDKPVAQEQPIAWPEDYRGRMAALTAERAELTRQFSDGEITLEEKDREQDKIDEARHDLRGAQQKAEIHAETLQKQSASTWVADQQSFFKTNPEYAKNRMLLAAFDAYVREEGANPENANRDGAWFLNKAHERVQTDVAGLGLVPVKPVVPVVPAKPRAKPNLAAVPRTLGTLPTAQAAETSAGSEFAAIDKLSGLDLENALARMTPEQEQRYLRSS